MRRGVGVVFSAAVGTWCAILERQQTRTQRSREDAEEDGREDGREGSREGSMRSLLPQLQLHPPPEDEPQLETTQPSKEEWSRDDEPR